MMISNAQLAATFLDPPLLNYFRSKFAGLRDEELSARLQETLKFLFISHECVGAIPVSREIDDIWHAWILQTQEYAALCGRLPAGSFIHHSSNDYLRYFDPAIGEESNPLNDVKMLALYVANFGPFQAGRTRYWLLADHLVDRRQWSVEQLNDWLLSVPNRAFSYPRIRAFISRTARSSPTITARPMMECPMFNSQIPLISAMGPTLR
jgi:hypothetical protein